MCGGLYITAVAVGDCAMRCCSRCWCKQSRLMIPGDSSHELWCRWPTFINQRRVGGGERREQNKAQIDVPSTAAGISWLHWPRWPPSPRVYLLKLWPFCSRSCRSQWPGSNSAAPPPSCHPDPPHANCGSGSADTVAVIYFHFLFPLYLRAAISSVYSCAAVLLLHRKWMRWVG